MSENKKANIIWGGRFSKGPSSIMQAINASITFDKRLFVQDIKASIAHVKMLSSQKIIEKDDANIIEEALKKISKEIESGKFEFSEEFEDIHMNIEKRLTDLIGAKAGLLHTARSRNDQVATDMRLWVRDANDEIVVSLHELMRSFLKQAENGLEMLMPGFTHLQVAQPITFGHHMLAYVEMFSRDRSRYVDNRSRSNESPLGAAALAGTSFPIDRFLTARELGFSKPMSNSLDAVSDRDFALDFLAANSICASHLSRFAEELVIWTSPQFNFVTVSEEFSTGSSIMPQKKNPDAAELIRGKVGRINGALIALLTVMKGLPLAYSKDLQEDKEQIFDSTDNLLLSIKVMTNLVNALTLNEKNLRKSAAYGFSTATDLADWIVQKLKMPFREAHHLSGRIVKIAEEKNCALHELELMDLKSIEKRIDASVFKVLSLEESVASRISFGGTAPQEVKKQIKYWKENLSC